VFPPNDGLLEDLFCLAFEEAFIGEVFSKKKYNYICLSLVIDRAQSKFIL
jgi:hypothetical protein